MVNNDNQWLIYRFGGDWNHGILWLSIYWECHHPSWRTHIFQRGRYTTNQSSLGRLGSFVRDMSMGQKPGGQHMSTPKFEGFMDLHPAQNHGYDRSRPILIVAAMKAFLRMTYHRLGLQIRGTIGPVLLPYHVPKLLAPNQLPQFLGPRLTNLAPWTIPEFLGSTIWGIYEDSMTIIVMIILCHYNITRSIHINIRINIYIYIYIYIYVYMEPFKSKSKILKDSRHFQQLLNHYAATGSLALSRYAAGWLGVAKKSLRRSGSRGFFMGKYRENHGKVLCNLEK